MWDFESIYAKAQTYFERGAQHEHSDDEEFVIWHLLGFEFLLRAPLAKVHPSMLAAPEGDSVLSANGIPTANEPKSIPSHSVISRLSQFVPDFTKERQQDSTILLNLRNAELHTGAAAVANVGNSFWLPKLIRAAEPIASYIRVGLTDILDVDVVKLGQSLVDLEDKKLAHEVATKIETARAFFAKLTASEVASRLGPFAFFGRRVNCPGCNSDVRIETERIRTTAERFTEDSAIRDSIHVATSFACPACNLELDSTAEIVAAGLPQQFTEEVWEDLSERFQDQFIDDDYGND